MSLAFDRSGRGPTLLLIHPTGFARRSWDLVMDALGPERDVVRVDLPGFGESRPLPARVRPTPAALASAVEELLDDQAIDDAHIAGCSLGGFVALELAARRRARTLTLLSPSGFGSEIERRYLRLVLRSARGVTRLIDPAATALLTPPPLRAALSKSMLVNGARVPRDVLVAGTHDVAGSPDYDRLVAATTDAPFAAAERVTCPVTIAWGRQDRTLPFRQSRRALAALPQARLVALERCGHLAMLDQPDATARLLLDGTRA